MINLKVLDIIQQSVQRGGGETEVITVAIDEASLKKYGQWPWSRSRLAALLDNIDTLGAGSIGVVMLLPEKERNVHGGKRKGEGREDEESFELVMQSMDASVPDEHMAAVLKNGPFVVGYEFLFGTADLKSEECALRPVSLNIRGYEDMIAPPFSFHEAGGVICNYKILAKAISRSGFLNGTPDLDGVLRRLPLLIEYDDKLFPSFALSVLMQYKRHDLLILKKDIVDIPRLSLADFHIPMDEKGNFLLGSQSLEMNKHISALDVLEGNSLKESFTGKIVLVGLTASGLGQEFATPYSPVTSLLDLHKYSIETLMSGLIPVRTQFFPVYEVVLSFLCCLVLALCCPYISTIWTISLYILTFCFTWIVVVICYQKSGFLFSPLLPSISLVVGGGLVLMTKFHHYQVKARSEVGDTLEMLKASEESLHSILKTIPDIVFRLDTTARITFISPAIGKYLSHPESLIGLPVFELVAPEDREMAEYRMNERRTGDRATFDLEIRLLLSKGEEKEQAQQFFSVSAEGMYEQNGAGALNFLGTQGIVRDISDRKRLEAQLIQAQKMEAVGNLASGVAHDLNNILCGLVSYPDLLLLDISKEDELHDKISLIQKSGKKAAIIVQDLLTLARRNVESNEICTINSVISEYLNSVEFKKVKTKYPEIQIHTHLQDNLMNIEGSPAHLSKALMNLIHNSLESMPSGGEIIITTAEITVEEGIDGYEPIPEGVYICISVMDNGVGISRQDLQRIFEPFYTRKEMSRSGTGLGMTVIWATIKDHGGYIDIESEEGQGTTIKIYLPGVEGAAETSKPRFVLENILGTETILLVDDIPEQLEISSSMLTKLGYTTYTTDGAGGALNLLAEHPIDLVVLDMIMPEQMDGLETYQKILEISPNQKAIITSGYSESARVKELQRLGAGAYVQKPFTIETFGMAVREELDKQRAKDT